MKKTKVTKKIRGRCRSLKKSVPNKVREDGDLCGGKGDLLFITAVITLISPEVPVIAQSGGLGDLRAGRTADMTQNLVALSYCMGLFIYYVIQGPPPIFITILHGHVIL